MGLRGGGGGQKCEIKK
jgi:hypothetical protein